MGRASRSMARSRGHSRRGERCRAAVPHAHWKTTTLGPALTTSAMAAPMILDGATDGEMFTADVAHVLLKERRPGDGVVLSTISPPIRWPLCAGSSKRLTHTSCIYRPVRHTSIRLRRRFPKSRLASKRKPIEQKRASITPSQTQLMAARQNRQPTTLQHADIKAIQRERIPLWSRCNQSMA